MAELADALFRGDSWDFPGMRTTQILHTNSEDCNAESPVQAKVEEQSAFRAASILSAPNILAETGNSSLQARQAAFKGDVASLAGPDTLANSVPLNLTFSNSSNSTNCCIPSVRPQAAISYDIKASAQVAEHIPNSTSLFQTPALQQQQQQQQQTRHLNGNSQAPPLPAANAARLHQFMASVFDDVDSGRIQHTGMSSNPFPGSALPHRDIVHSGSFPPEMRGYFPAIDQPNQQVLQTQFLAQQLLEQQQQQQQAAQQQHQQPPFVQQNTAFQHTAQHQAAAHRRGSTAAQWQQPLSNSAADSEQSRKAAKHKRSKVEAQHRLDELDLSALKRDFSSFSSPGPQGKPNRQAATRRANSFTHGSAASVTTASPASTARKPRGAASSSQAAASGSHVASPLTSMANLPDSDVSVSEAEGHSGAEEADGSKRQRVVKGRRGARVARRMLCKNCGAHQTPQWRCGPLGPRTLCNACGVRYKKGLPLTGPARSAELA